MISAEQFEEWKEHPVTKEIFSNLIELKESIKEQLAHGSTIGADAEATHSLTSRAVGQLDGINQLLNISYASEAPADEVNEQSGY
jgi:uncharacterized phage-associated protein